MSIRVSGAIAAVGLLAAAAQAQAGEVHVFSAGAVKSIVTDLVPAYEKETGNKVLMEFGPMGFVRQKLASAPTDVVIMSDTVLDDSIAKGGVGRSKGNHPMTPWGKPTKGYKTRKNQSTDKYIVQRRKGR